MIFLFLDFMGESLLKLWFIYKVTGSPPEDPCIPYEVLAVRPSRVAVYFEKLFNFDEYLH